MRDLLKDKKWIHTFSQRPCRGKDELVDFALEAYDAWPHAIERALKAEELLRDILPMAMWESCRYREHAEADPTTHCCDWNEIAERIREVSTEEGEHGQDLDTP